MQRSKSLNSLTPLAFALAATTAGASACTDKGGDGNDGAIDDDAGCDILCEDDVDGDGIDESDGGDLRLDLGSDDGATTDEGGADDGDPVCMQDIDIVFVMDVSTTMAGFFDELEAEIDAVHQYVDALPTPNPPHYGLVVFVDDFLVTNGGAPYTDVNALRNEFAMWNNFTATNSQVSGGGSNSTFPENSLDAIYAGAAAFNWRAEASTLRLIVHTTDDTFWDGPTTGNGISIQRSYDDTVMALQSRQIRQFTFADLLGGATGTSDVSMGWSAPYMGKDPIPDQTFGGWWNINDVLSQQISLADAINQAVEDTMCEEYPPVG